MFARALPGRYPFAGEGAAKVHGSLASQAAGWLVRKGYSRSLHMPDARRSEGYALRRRSMAPGIDRERLGARMAAIVISGLFVSVTLANVLWPGPPPAEGGQPRMPPTTNPFPVFSMGSSPLTIRLDADTNLSMRLFLTSLQGLVNRAGVELYLNGTDVAGNTSTMLTFLASRYNVTHDTISIPAALASYANRSRGLIVYDPSRPESINIGTMIAAQRNATLVGPDLANWFVGRYGLPILFNYAESDWRSLDPIGVYDRAMRELYPDSTSTLLSILPPDRWAIRDYLVATRTFVFYLPQGILASPFEASATRRILHGTPRGIPILGWFNSPTLTEENSFVQMASGEGKFVVGAQDVPNLSVLTAIGRNVTHLQGPRAPIRSLENKTYAVIAIPDGDNLDFVAGRMRELWSEPVRGTMPLAWSMSPLLVDLAPPLLDEYYTNATSTDQFIAAPSGAGYLYPDYVGAGDLLAFAAFSKRYLDAADMDIIWLLNAFTASEIPYSSARLAAYTDGVRPRGIVLDYDDQPRTRDTWMQAGSNAVAPVVRSTHFWTTADNVLGKLGAATATWDAGPHFLWLTIYTFRFDLRDAKALVDILGARLGGNLEVVTPDEFFGLLEQDFVRSARTRFEAMAADPLASLVAGASLDAARARLRDADAYLATGDTNKAADSAFRGLESLQAAAATEILLVSLLVVLIGGFLAFIATRSARRSSHPSDPVHPATILLVAAAVGLFVFALRDAVDQNFWTYPTILVGIAVAGTSIPTMRLLDRAYPDRAAVAAVLVDLVFTTLAIRTSAAFPLALIGVLLAIGTYLARRPASSVEVLVGLAFGVAVGFVGRFDLPTFTGLALILLLPALALRGPPMRRELATRPKAVLPGFLLALPLSALAVGSYYSTSLRLEIQGETLFAVAGALLVSAATLAALAYGGVLHGSPRIATMASLALAAIFGGAVLVTRGPIPTFLALLALFTSISFAAIEGVQEYLQRGGESVKPLMWAIMFLPLFVLFFRMPPIVYSLTTLRLPETLEVALYAPTALIAATCLLLAAFIALRGRLRKDAGKDYAAEAHGGLGGS